MTTGDPVSADPWALAASRGGYDCGAAPRAGCTVTTAYATAPACGSPVAHAAPGSPVLVFSPFAARNAPQPPQNVLVSNNIEAATRVASGVAPSYPADRDSLTSDRTAFEARRSADAARLANPGCRCKPASSSTISFTKAMAALFSLAAHYLPEDILGLGGFCGSPRNYPLLPTVLPRDRDGKFFYSFLCTLSVWVGTCILC